MDKVATPKAAVSMAKKTSLVVVVIMALLTIYGTRFNGLSPRAACHDVRFCCLMALRLSGTASHPQAHVK